MQIVRQYRPRFAAGKDTDRGDSIEESKNRLELDRYSFRALFLFQFHRDH